MLLFNNRYPIIEYKLMDEIWTTWLEVIVNLEIRKAYLNYVVEYTVKNKTYMFKFNLYINIRIELNLIIA